jgi:A/G-specific adenine glycosylase
LSVRQTEGAFAARVVAWQQRHGRNDLPWQNTRDPYRVWLSEIMLQQTQVVTVLAYFERFVARCPDVKSLAQATLDDVLGLWSGLGYYSRARNLHRCAQNVVELHGGFFPQTAQALETLPGIGRSTAAAIASLCFGERVAILDANVKRVVTRVVGFDADLARASNVRALWEAATTLLPQGRTAATAMPRYTQGMMDLGATVCLPKKPDCSNCPVRSDCVAADAGDPQRYPVRTRTLKRSSQSIWLMWVQTDECAVWLSKRPTPGVWAGLYCLPLYESEAELLLEVPPDLRKHLQPVPAVTHVLTHKDLHLHPWRLVLPAQAVKKVQWNDGQWIQADAWPALGLPAPIRKLLQQDTTR